MKEKTSIVLITCNRKDLSKKTIDGFYERLVNNKFIHLIVVDNNSQDGTVDLLKEYEKNNKIHKLVLLDKENEVNISGAYNIGFKHVESELFFTAQDDVIIPELVPDVIEQLIDLLERYPEASMIGTRIQRIPNVNWTDGDITPARKALSSYFRVQRKSEFLKMGENPFGTRNWDDIGTLSNVRNKLKKEGFWANNLWCDHLGYMIEKRGYGDYNRKWSSVGSHTRIADLRKPYPKVDPKTNMPLPGQRVYK